MEPLPGEKRLRVQSKRSTTGCQTCRDRRVKCDERRPLCGRCVASRRLCSYGHLDEHSGWSKFVIYSVPPVFSQSPGLARPQKRALHYYRCSAAQGLTAPFKNDFWKHGIYALADQYDFVQSALIALSMMHEAYFDTASKERLFSQAMGHYNRAIRAIGDATADELPTDAVFVASKLFANVEALRGGFQRALMHAQYGLRILCQDMTASVSGQQSEFEKALRHSSLELQNQIAEFSHADGPVLNRPLGKWRKPAVPLTFDTIDDCLHGIEVGANIMWEMLDNLYETQQAGAAEDHTSKLKAEMDGLINSMMSMGKAWSSAVDRLVATAALSKDEDEKASILLLQIQQTMVRSILARFPSETSLQEEIAAECVDLCEVFLRQHNIKDHKGRAFSLSTGVVRTLFQLSVRTNVESTRVRCIERLRTANRREGVWDSTLAHQMAYRASKVRDEIVARAGGAGGTVQVKRFGFVSEQTAQIVYSITSPEVKVAGSGDGVSAQENGEVRRRVDYIDLSTLAA